MLLGPAINVTLFWQAEYHRCFLGENNPELLGVWRRHFVWVSIILLWIWGVCRIPLLSYLAFFVYPSIALSNLRSFTEHRPHESIAKRTAIVETSWPLSLLFLNNNLHALHHANPRIAWYRLPEVYRKCRHVILKRNGDFFYNGYTEILYRFAFAPKDSPIYPLDIPLLFDEESKQVP